MKEGRDNKEMVLEEDSYHIFLSFLLFLYTSVAQTDNFTRDDYVDLLFLSNRFFLQELKLICEKRLKQFINIKSVLHLYDVCYHSKIIQNSFKTNHSIFCCYSFLFILHS